MSGEARLHQACEGNRSHGVVVVRLPSSTPTTGRLCSLVESQYACYSLLAAVSQRSPSPPCQFTQLRRPTQGNTGGDGRSNTGLAQGGWTSCRTRSSSASAFATRGLWSRRLTAWHCGSAACCGCLGFRNTPCTCSHTPSPGSDPHRLPHRRWYNVCCSCSPPVQLQPRGLAQCLPSH